MASAPFNIIVGPYEVWTAPTGTAFPAVTAAPAGPWAKLGLNGSLETDDEGVKITHNQTVDLHSFLGDTGPRKATRSAEELHIELTIHDLALESYAAAMNGQTVTTAAGPPATKAIPLWRGFDVGQTALLIRGASPYSATGVAQFEVPVAVMVGEPEVTFNKTDPAGLMFEFVALSNPSAATAAARFGQLIAATA